MNNIHYQDDEIELILELVEQKVQKKKSADEVNKKFHNGEPIRSKNSIRYVERTYKNDKSKPDLLLQEVTKNNNKHNDMQNEEVHMKKKQDQQEDKTVEMKYTGKLKGRIPGLGEVKSGSVICVPVNLAARLKHDVNWRIVEKKNEANGGKK